MPLMDGYRIDTYGDSFADVYDDWYPTVPGCTEMLEELADGDPVLDLGAGTCAIAASLAGRGHPVVALDASEKMLRRAQARMGAPVGEVGCQLVRADMSHLPFAGRGSFGTVFISYNTLFNLTEVEAQDRCLREATACLRPGGALVMEAFVPAVDARRDDVSVSRMATDRVVLTASRHDPEAQRVDGQHIEIDASGVHLRPWAIRYATPAELDERLSRIGYDLTARYGGWRREPFDDSCDRHVSIWRSQPERAAERLSAASGS